MVEILNSQFYCIFLWRHKHISSFSNRLRSKSKCESNLSYFICRFCHKKLLIYMPFQNVISLLRKSATFFFQMCLYLTHIVNILEYYMWNTCRLYCIITCIINKIKKINKIKRSTCDHQQFSELVWVSGDGANLHIHRILCILNEARV